MHSRCAPACEIEMVCSAMLTVRGRQSSTLTRIIYAVFLMLGAITAWVMLSGTVSSALTSVRDDVDTRVELMRAGAQSSIITQSLCTFQTNCNVSSELAGTMAVYRVCFGMTLFFALFALLTIGIQNSRDSRAALHNGWWASKFLFFAALIVAAFFIPNGFYFTWAKIALAGSFLFVLVQLVLLVDFSYSLADRFTTTYEETGSCMSAGALVATSAVLYGVTLLLTIILFVFYGSGSECGLNKFFFAMNLILCFASSYLSVHPRVREAQPKCVCGLILKMMQRRRCRR
jgi:serine incorporator 1/3